MTHYTGSVIAVPSANKADYLAHSKSHWSLFQRYGAQRMVETWGVDVPRGKVNDFYGAVAAKDGEVVVFSWIEWADKAAADQAWQEMQGDPAMKELPSMPYDGSRMIFGSFDPLVAEGSSRGAAYIQGFLLPVPEQNKPAYTKLAREVWESDFQPNGCLAIMEGWGVDVPHGKQTDFYRAVQAKAGEVPMFSWTAWPDKATCDAAAAAMVAGSSNEPHPEMPFDGMRMIWGGFEVIFDSESV